MKINWFYVIVAVLFCAAIYFLDVGLHFLVKKLFCMINPITMPVAGVVDTGQYSMLPSNASILGAAAIAGGASLINGVLGLFSKNKANKQNIALQRETNALNYQMFQEGNEFNRQMAFDMFNAENAYNTPAAQAKRLEQAGLNPALVAEQATATTGNASGQAPSAASAAPMVAPQVMPVGSPFESIFDSVEKLASAFEKTNSGKLHESQKEFVLEQAKSERLDQIHQQIENEIIKEFGAAEADQRVKNLAKDILNKEAEIKLKVQQGKVAEAEALLKKAQEIAQQNENKLFDRTFELLVSKLTEEVNLLKAEVKTENAKPSLMKSEEASNYSSADLNKALRITENITRWDKKKDLQEAIRTKRFGRAVQMVDAYLKANGYNQPIWNLGAQFYDKLVQSLKNLSGDDNSVEEFRDWLDRYADDEDYYKK